MNEHPPTSGSEDTQKAELGILVRKMWVRWILVCAAGPMFASALLVLGEKFSAVRVVTALILPIIIIIGIILIFVVSIQLGQAVGEQKGMSPSRRIVFEGMMVIGAFMIALFTSAATCGIGFSLT